MSGSTSGVRAPDVARRGPAFSETLSFMERVEPETRTLVVTDDPLFGEGVRRLLDEAGHGPVFCVDSIQRAQRFCASDTAEQRHLVLWFLEILDYETFDAAHWLRHAASTGLCVVAESVDIELVQELMRERGGWFSVLLRRQKPNLAQITRTLAQLSEGSATVDCRILRHLVANGQRHALSNLNAMDQRVLELVAAGLRNGEIARRTRRSEKAVEKHVGRLFAKLGLDAQGNGHLDRRVVAAKLFYATRRIPSSPEA